MTKSKTLKKKLITALSVTIVLLMMLLPMKLFAVEISQSDLDTKNKTIASQQYDLNLKDAEIIVLKGKVENKEEVIKKLENQIFWDNVVKVSFFVAVAVASL